MHTHPGRLFIQTYGPVDGPERVKQYAAFLREEAGLGTEPPVDLAAVFQIFGIPKPKRVTLPGQQGLLLDAELGIIFIEERDLETRQRFSEAHELIELLFAAIPMQSGSYGGDVGNFKHAAKERLCNEGAAELIMPAASYLPRIENFGISFETGQILAAEYEVSLSAALVRMAKLGAGRHAIVLWTMKNKPTEIRNKVPDNQLPLIDIPMERIAPKKIRVEYSFARSEVPYIPIDKSASENSSIYSALHNRAFTAGADWLDLGSVSGTFYCENLPFEVEGEWWVLSLLHFPDDNTCKWHL